MPGTESWPEDALFLGPPGTGKSHLAQANELAALAHRDFRRVYEDVMSLSEAGLLDLTRDKGRKTAPRVADELRLEIVV